jgi:hypothetical protein
MKLFLYNNSVDISREKSEEPRYCSPKSTWVYRENANDIIIMRTCI